MFQSSFLLFLHILGFVSVAKFTLVSLYYFYAYFIRPAKDLKSHYGPWALITGPTDGIGKAIAVELARKNLNLILVGRNPVKLKNVSTFIQCEFRNIKIKSVVIDLSKDLHEGMRILREDIVGLEVGVVVNNAGTSFPRPIFFHKCNMEVWMELVRVNTEAMTAVTRVVLPGMLDRKKGAIVNIASGSTVALPSLPLYTVYAATKAYVDQLSKCLHNEYKDNGINAQSQVPLFVNTNLLPNKVRASFLHSFVMATTNAYARAAVNWIGYDQQCSPYFPHFLQSCISRMVPDVVWFYALQRIYNIDKRRVARF